MAEINIEPLSLVVTEQQARLIIKKFGTPTYVYSQELLEQQAEEALAFPNAFGLTVRYAMKASSNVNILRILDAKGIHIDASSGLEAERAMDAEILPENILLTSQQIPGNLEQLVNDRVEYNACSLYQLETYGRLFPNSIVSVRINPGLGSGWNNMTNTGGLGSSFGIWHGQLPEVFKMLDKYGLNVDRVHTHIGSGSDPEVWKKVAGMSLDIVERFIKNNHEVRTLNLGGGYKVGRMQGEFSADLQNCGRPVKDLFEHFYREGYGKLHLEIEPGTFLTANAGCLVSRIVDMKSTPDYDFVISDTGMTEVTRPALYGAQHPISVVPTDGSKRGTGEYIVSGHCCESGDILTPVIEKPGELQPRQLLEARIGDIVVIGGTGAYCASMSAANYNSYLRAAEVLIGNNGIPQLIRKRQTLDQLTQNELIVID